MRDLTAIDADLDHQAEVALVAFLHCKVTSRLCTVWKEITMCSSHSRSNVCSTSLRSEYLHTLFRIQPRICSSCPSFTYLVKNLYQYGLTYICFMLWVILRYFILLPKFFRFWHWKYFHLTSVSLDFPPWWCSSCLFFKSCPFWYLQDAPDSPWIFPAWVLESTISARSPGHFY